MRAGLWLAAGLLALAAGCGGSSGTSSTTTTMTRAVNAGTTTVHVALPSFKTGNCAKLAKLGETFASTLQSTGANTTLGGEAQALRKMADSAPSEIRGEFHTLADAFGGYAQALEDAGITAGATPTAAQVAKLGAAAKKLGTADVQAAAQKISAWAAANCGIKTTTGG